MKNNPESGEFCCLHICLFNNGKAIHFRTTLTPLRLLFLLLTYCDRSVRPSTVSVTTYMYVRSLVVAFTVFYMAF